VVGAPKPVDTPFDQAVLHVGTQFKYEEGTTTGAEDGAEVAVADSSTATLSAATADSLSSAAAAVPLPQRSGKQCHVRMYYSSFDLEEPGFRFDTSSPAGNGTCVVEAFVSGTEGVGLAINALTTLAVVVSVATLVAVGVFRKRYVLQSSSPKFCAIICIGTAISFSMLLTLIGRPTDQTCVARNWVGMVGFVLLLAPLLAKTYRIAKIFNNQSLKKLKITDNDLLKIVGGSLGAVVVWLAIWTLGEPPRVVVSADEADPFKMWLECSSPHFDTLAAINHCMVAGAMLLGVRLAYQTREVRSEFNESGQIGLIIYNMFATAVVITPMVYLLDVKPEARVTLVAVGVFLVGGMAMVVLFGPKFWNINTTKSEFDDRFTQKTMATSSGHTTSGAGSTKVQPIAD
jgi:hypothetical protein